ncbi:MAG: MBL fold metallo-hydrolase, partial [Clostridia bacterium]|nr:MBL fold metallo-hydrolase [Clostridia bacterium]
MKHMLCQLGSVTGSQMNSYVITTADGKVIVVDGGYREDAQKLLAYLREITDREIPRVDAWLLTHAHGDHICAFNEIMDKYPDALELGRVC